MPQIKDTVLQEILILQELVLFNLNHEMIPIDLEIKGTPLKNKERLTKLEA